MPTYIGFNTIGQRKRFTLTDFELVKRDLLNAFSIKQGEKPGRPETGTAIWNMVFEPQTDKTVGLVNREIQRVVGQDPRIVLENSNVYVQSNGILVELEIRIVNNNLTELLNLFFDRESNRLRQL